MKTIVFMILLPIQSFQLSTKCGSCRRVLKMQKWLHSSELVIRSVYFQLQVLINYGSVFKPWECIVVNLNHQLSCQNQRYPLLHRSEEHTSELQSRGHLVCRLLLEKKKTTDRNDQTALTSH